MPTTTLTQCLTMVRLHIPKEMLELAFPDQTVSLDYQIMDAVIIPLVRNNINFQCGRFERIPLVDDYLEETTAPTYASIVGVDMTTAVYRIPPEARHNADIISISSITPIALTNYPSALNSTGIQGTVGSDIPSMLNMALTSTTNRQALRPHAVPIAPNIIRVSPRIFNMGFALECYLDFDEEFTGLPNGMLTLLRDLCICATKAYVYNTLYMKVDANVVVSGHTMGSFKEVLERYSGEAERMTELLNSFQRSMSMDTETLKRRLSFAL